MNQIQTALSAYNHYTTDILNKTILSINISNNLTLIEHKFWNHLLFAAQQDISKQIYSVPIKEFIQLIGSSSNRQTHKKVIKIFDSLLSKIINFIKETDTKFNKTTYVSSVKLENGIINFEFSQNFKDNLVKINLDDNKINPYVALNLQKVNLISGKYTIALYEFIKSRIFATKEVITDVAYLRQLISPNIYYSIFSRFNDKVLKNAIKEINEKTDLNIVKFETIKSYDNKTVSKVKFIVETKKIDKLDTSNLKYDTANTKSIKTEKISITEPVKNSIKSVVEKIKEIPSKIAKYNFDTNQQEVFTELRSYGVSEKLSIEAVKTSIELVNMIKYEILTTKPNILTEGNFGGLFKVKWDNKASYERKIEAKKAKFQAEAEKAKEVKLQAKKEQEQKEISNQKSQEKIHRYTKIYNALNDKEKKELLTFCSRESFFKLHHYIENDKFINLDNFAISHKMVVITYLEKRENATNIVPENIAVKNKIKEQNNNTSRLNDLLNGLTLNFSM